MRVSDLQTLPKRKAGATLVRTGLLGREILASRSPWLHQEEARAHGLGLDYELYDFSARRWGDDELGDRLASLKRDGLAGVNVTHPFKQLVIQHLDGLAPSAETLGAVNTVQFCDAGMIGHNTDVTGFAESVQKGLEGAALQRVIQFGAGGAGSATAHALLSLGVSELVLVDADVSRCEALVDRLASENAGASIAQGEANAALIASADGIVNATPMGMSAHPGTPFDPDFLGSDQWVADIVYFPLETELLKQASARGCRTLSGKGMAVFQAADAFEIFTGLQADRARMLVSFDAFAARTPTRS
jgi:shikimate dehydrogenase